MLAGKEPTRHAASPPPAENDFDPLCPTVWRTHRVENIMINDQRFWSRRELLEFAMVAGLGTFVVPSAASVLVHNAEGVRQFEPRVGAQRQPWDTNTKEPPTLKGFLPHLQPFQTFNPFRVGMALPEKWSSSVSRVLAPEEQHVYSPDS
jgi:hypothetical protein